LGSNIIKIKAWDVSELKIRSAAVDAMAFVEVIFGMRDRARGTDENGRV
jgi:hypothetical protein